MDNPSYSRTTMDPSDQHNMAGASPGGSEGARGSSTPVNRSFQLNDSTNFMRHPSTELLTEETGYMPPPLTQYDPNPGGMTYNPSTTLNRDTLPNLEPPSPRPTYTIPDKAPMKEKSRPSLCRPSMVLNGILLLGIVGGIIMTACIAADSNLIYVGPVILGFSIFASCGKAYFTLWWEEDPLPFLNPYVAKMEEQLGADKDPYGLKATKATEMEQFGYPKQQQVFAPTMFNYPNPAPPQFDYPNPQQDVSFQANTPTYNSPTPTQEYNSANTSRDYNIPAPDPRQ